MTKLKLNYLLLLTLFNSAFFSAQNLSSTELRKVYSIAIGEFIRKAINQNQTTFDTVFILKRKNGQPDDFPDLLLPPEIERTAIRVISEATAKNKTHLSTASVYLNLIAWVEKNEAEFIMVVFSDGFKHLYDYFLHYKRESPAQVWQLTACELKTTH